MLLNLRFDKIDGFTGINDGSRYLVLYGSEKNNFIYNRIGHFIEVKSGMKYAIFHNDAKIKLEPYDSLTLQKTLTFHNVLILQSLMF